MKKISVYVLSALFVFLILSCENSLGTPPELVLSFTIDGVDNTGTIKISYTLKNEGEEDLENCKIQIDVDNTGGTDFTYWTDGADINKGKTYSAVDEDTGQSGSAVVDGLTVIAAGFDSAKSVTGRTVIYYYNE